MVETREETRGLLEGFKGPSDGDLVSRIEEKVYSFKNCIIEVPRSESRREGKQGV